MSVQLLQEPAATCRLSGAAIRSGGRKSALSACLNKVAVWILRSGERGALRQLADDKRLLQDIGLTREQVLGEASKHFWHR
jgi:uncharacterized protein YjiS (DUF1127 family)